MSPRRFGRFLLAVLITLTAVRMSRTAEAQDPKAAPASSPAQGAARGGVSVGDLSAFYRLKERFTIRPANQDPEAVGQLQIGFRETSSTNDPRDKEPRVVQAIYSERPATLSPVDDRTVIDSVRHYSSVTITPDPWKGRTDRRPLNDLTIWYRTIPGDVPAVMVLTPGRPLREEEYKFAINYDFVTDLAFLLPDLPKRIGETWIVERTGGIALVNDEIRGGTLTAKLVEVRTHATLPDLHVAVIEITGQITTGFDRDVRETAVRARIDFAFKPNARDATNVDAFGWIEKLTLAQVSSLTVAGQTQPKKYNRQFVLECKNPGDGPALVIPTPEPTLTPENSWLTYTDPQNRFHVRHPQGFQPTFPAGMPDAVDLRRFRPNPPDDIVRLEYIEKPTAKPEEMFKTLITGWQSNGIEVLPGLSERLKDSEWPGMGVYHLDAALTNADPQGGPSLRRYFDAYVIQFPRDVSLFISATTGQEQPAEFRAEVLAMLKTLKLGPPK